MMNELDRYKPNFNLTPHSNFSFELIEHEQWEYAKLNNSLFNGAVFIDCMFNEIVFDNADLEGTRFSDCIFRNCSFFGADIHSIWAADCQFNSVIFDETILTDCTFQNCSFESCSFNGTSQMECIFDTCTIDPFTPKGSSITLNQYKNTTFHHAVFNNVFYYQWFENCRMPDATFEAYLLGYIYGLTPQNLEECHIVMMGNQEGYPSYSEGNNISDIYQIIESIYDERHMYLNMGILELGNEKNSRDEILLKCIYLLGQLLADNQLLKNEQIKFLERLIMSLYEQGQIITITIYLMERELQKIVNKYQNKIKDISWKKAEKDIVTLKNRLYFIFLGFLDKLQVALQGLPNPNNPILCFIYKEKPQIPFIQVVTAMMPEFPVPVQIKEEKGSYVETIQFCTEALPYIKIFLELMGIVVPIVLAVRSEQREDRKEKERTKKEEKEQSEQNQNSMTLPSVYISPGITAIAGLQVAQVTRVIIEYHLINDNQKKGYNSKNLKSINLIPNVKTSLDT